MRSISSKYILRFIILLLIVCAVAMLHMVDIDTARILGVIYDMGYPGIIAIGFLSGFNVVLPVPAVGAYPLFIEAGFARTGIIIALSIGMLMADAIGMWLGAAGRRMAHHGQAARIAARMQSLQQKHHILPYLFLCVYGAVIPLPNELLVIPMAFAGYRLWAMAAILFCANIIFNILGAFGIVSIMSLFV